jgi:hypothetical protein
MGVNVMEKDSRASSFAANLVGGHDNSQLQMSMNIGDTTQNMLAAFANELGG